MSPEEVVAALANLSPFTPLAQKASIYLKAIQFLYLCTKTKPVKNKYQRKENAYSLKEGGYCSLCGLESKDTIPVKLCSACLSRVKPEYTWESA